VIMVEYNMVQRRHSEGTIAAAFQRGVGVIAQSPLAQTLYSNDIFKVKSLTDLWYLARSLKNHRAKFSEASTRNQS